MVRTDRCQARFLDQMVRLADCRQGGDQATQIEQPLLAGFCLMFKVGCVPSHEAVGTGACMMPQLRHPRWACIALSPRKGMNAPTCSFCSGHLSGVLICKPYLTWACMGHVAPAVKLHAGMVGCKIPCVHALATMLL